MRCITTCFVLSLLLIAVVATSNHEQQQQDEKKSMFPASSTKQDDYIVWDAAAAPIAKPAESATAEAEKARFRTSQRLKARAKAGKKRPRRINWRFVRKSIPSECPQRCNNRGRCLIDLTRLQVSGRVLKYAYRCHCHPAWTGSACQTPVDQFLRWFESNGEAPFPRCCNVCPSQFANPVDYRSLPVYQNPYSTSTCDPSLSVDSRPGPEGKLPCWRPLQYQPLKDNNSKFPQRTNAKSLLPFKFGSFLQTSLTMQTRVRHEIISNNLAMVEAHAAVGLSSPADDIIDTIASASSATSTEYEPARKSQQEQADSEPTNNSGYGLKGGPAADSESNSNSNTNNPIDPPQAPDTGLEDMIADQGMGDDDDDNEGDNDEEQDEQQHQQQSASSSNNNNSSTAATPSDEADDSAHTFELLHAAEERVEQQYSPNSDLQLEDHGAQPDEIDADSAPSKPKGIIPATPLGASKAAADAAEARFASVEVGRGLRIAPSKWGQNIANVKQQYGGKVARELKKRVVTIQRRLRTQARREYRSRMRYKLVPCCIFCDFDFWTEANAIPTDHNNINANIMTTIRRHQLIERLSSQAIMREMMRRQLTREREELAMTENQLASFLEELAQQDLEVEKPHLEPLFLEASADATQLPSVSTVYLDKYFANRKDASVIAKRKQRITESDKQRKKRMQRQDANRAARRKARDQLKKAKRGSTGTGGDMRDVVDAGPQKCCNVCPVPARQPQYPYFKHKLDPVLSKADLRKQAKWVRTYTKTKKQEEQRLSAYLFGRIRKGRRNTPCCDYCPSQFFIRTVAADIRPFDGKEVDALDFKEVAPPTIAAMPGVPKPAAAASTSDPPTKPDPQAPGIPATDSRITPVQ